MLRTNCVAITTSLTFWCLVEGEPTPEAAGMGSGKVFQLGAQQDVLLSLYNITTDTHANYWHVAEIRHAYMWSFFVRQDCLHSIKNTKTMLHIKYM